MASCNCGRRKIKKHRVLKLMWCCGCVEFRRDISGRLLPPFCLRCQRRHYFSPEVSAAGCCGADHYVDSDAPNRLRFFAEGVRP